MTRDARSHSRLPQRSTVTGTVLSGDADLLCPLGLQESAGAQGIRNDSQGVGGLRRDADGLARRGGHRRVGGWYAELKSNCRTYCQCRPSRVDRARFDHPTKALSPTSFLAVKPTTATEWTARTAPHSHTPTLLQRHTAVHSIANQPITRQQRLIDESSMSRVCRSPSSIADAACPPCQSACVGPATGDSDSPFCRVMIDLTDKRGLKRLHKS